MAAAPWIVSDELWELVEPLLPKRERRFRSPGRKRLPDRDALQGDLVLAAHGIAWQLLLREDAERALGASVKKPWRGGMWRLWRRRGELPVQAAAVPARCERTAVQRRRV